MTNPTPINNKLMAIKHLTLGIGYSLLVLGELSFFVGSLLYKLFNKLNAFGRGLVIKGNKAPTEIPITQEPTPQEMILNMTEEEIDAELAARENFYSVIDNMGVDKPYLYDKLSGDAHLSHPGEDAKSFVEDMLDLPPTFDIDTAVNGAKILIHESAHEPIIEDVGALTEAEVEAKGQKELLKATVTIIKDGPVSDKPIKIKSSRKGTSALLY